MYKIFFQGLDSGTLVNIIRQELGNDTGSKNNLTHQAWAITIVSVILVVVGLWIYRNIWLKNREDLPNGRNKPGNNLSYIVSFTPNGKVKDHIIAGLCCSAGFSIFFGYIINRFVLDFSSTSFHANVLSIAGMAFAILTTSLTFWTLYQTKKLEHEAGHKIFEFHDWIKALSDEIARLLKSFNENKIRKDYHRVYIVTEHPFFGMLSFPSEPGTANYFGHLTQLMNCSVPATQTSGSVPKLDFEIICGDTQCIKTFITNYRRNAEPEKCKSDIEIFERSIANFIDRNIATRFSDIPKYPQFAVIGNVVFEFMIHAAEPETSIKEAHVYRDKNKADLYIELFKLMKKGLASPSSTVTSVPIST